MIPVAALDVLADGGTPKEPPVFLAVLGNPDGVEVSPVDGMIYINTVGPVANAPDPAGGGIYALDKNAFIDGDLPAPFDRNLGALDGLDFTAGGAMLNSQIREGGDAAIYVNCPGESAQPLTIEGDGAVLSGRLI